MSDTPQTNSKTGKLRHWYDYDDLAHELVPADFARQLERENNELRSSNDRMFKINEGLLAENADLASALEEALEAVECAQSYLPALTATESVNKRAADRARTILASHATQSK
jgi:hypothetical protein